MKKRKSQPMPDAGPPPGLEEAHRILQKMLVGGSTTADYVTTPYLSALQSKKASQVRLDDLQKLIIEIAEIGNITMRQLESELRRRVGEGVIVAMTSDDFVEWKTSEGALMKSPISGLKDRLYRAKRQLKKEASR